MVELVVREVCGVLVQVPRLGDERNAESFGSMV